MARLLIAPGLWSLHMFVLHIVSKSSNYAYAKEPYLRRVSLWPSIVV